MNNSKKMLSEYLKTCPVGPFMPDPMSGRFVGAVIKQFSEGDLVSVADIRSAKHAVLFEGKK